MRDEQTATCVSGEPSYARRPTSGKFSVSTKLPLPAEREDVRDLEPGVAIIAIDQPRVDHACLLRR